MGVCQDAQDSSRQLFLPLILGVLGRVQEVLMFILDAMMLEQPNLCQVVEASSGRSLINRIVLLISGQGWETTTLRCLVCERTSEKNESWRCLTLRVCGNTLEACQVL